MPTGRVPRKKLNSRKKLVIAFSPLPSPELIPVEDMEPIVLDGPAEVQAPNLALPEPLLPEMEMLDVEPLQPRIPSLDECLAALLVLFPDIDPNYVRGLHEEHVWNEHASLMDILVDIVLETNGNYPKIQRDDRSTKRKRERSPSDMTAGELDIKYGSLQRKNPGPGYVNLSRKHLRNAFPFIPATAIDAEFAKSRNFIFPAYRSLAQAEADYEKAGVKPYKKLGRTRKAVSEDILAHEGERLGMDEYTSFTDELGAARRIFEHLTSKLTNELSYYEHNLTESLVKGRINAGGLENIESIEGSPDGAVFECSGCQKEFPIHEVKRFCDAKMLEALERLEQRDVLRRAEIDDLSECPFCDFAAILPPVEDDREFRCQNPDCMKISCRLCDKETHIPLTCEEKAKEESSSLRRNVEEAMTEALLRKCGKCGLPYVKESGCNKIVCSRCSAINWYVPIYNLITIDLLLTAITSYLCSKVIKDYKHFNDPNRGGKVGNCLLFDNTDERHHNEVQAAEQAAINKIRAENPDISEEEMRVRLSKVVLDSERQKIDEGNRRLGINNPQPIVPVRPVVAQQPVMMPPNLPGQPAYVFRAVPAPAGHHHYAVPQVIYQPIQVPFQPVLVPHVPPNPIQMVPRPLGIPNAPPNFQQELRHPLIQVPPIPILGNPVPFLGGHPPGFPVAAAMPQANPPQPVGIFQRVAGLLPMGRPVIRARAVPIQMPQMAIPQPAPLNINVPNMMPIQNANLAVNPQGNPPAPVPAQENVGFIQRNFNLGGNRLVARGRQAIRNQNNFNARPITFIEDDVRGLQPFNNKPGQMSPARNRPAKIAKRGSR
ncbi:E3 ubiquitin-protein ligase [Drechslerella dactyloides]|uniref:E3 ubiquitin-protein ligase n=1 Tax=Drechslerella dactyloides TaxID=74499 RepID=A0AAD6NMB1_DREDA|nr:E3 ubiquitin-protein ligase [Drechslerella dactyloides]